MENTLGAGSVSKSGFDGLGTTSTTLTPMPATSETTGMLSPRTCSEDNTGSDGERDPTDPLADGERADLSVERLV